MKRYTKKIKNANNYCEYDLKYSPYKEMFDLTSNVQIEDYVNADLTLAIDKLGKLEDLEEQLGCPLEVREKALQQDEIFYVERNQTKMIRVTAMNCGYVNNGECVLNCLANGIWFCLPVKDYKKTWWLKEDKSE